MKVSSIDDTLSPDCCMSSVATGVPRQRRPFEFGTHFAEGFRIKEVGMLRNHLLLVGLIGAHFSLGCHAPRVESTRFDSLDLTETWTEVSAPGSGRCAAPEFNLVRGDDSRHTAGCQRIRSCSFFVLSDAAFVCAH